MTRGRIPERALANAEPIAAKRGIVQHYVREPGTICDFEIISPGIVAKVSLKCVRRLGGTAKEMERDLAAEIAEIRIIASSQEISRELWLCSPRYAYRFFRVLDDGLVELGRDGSPLPAPAAGTGLPGPTPGSGSANGPARSAAATGSGSIPGTAQPGTLSGADPQGAGTPASDGPWRSY
jgi:hypothetical protein